MREPEPPHSQSLMLLSRPLPSRNFKNNDTRTLTKVHDQLLLGSPAGMSRQVPWRRNCPDVVSYRIQQANQSRIYLLRETGPTGFLLKEDGAEKKFKVFLGDLHSCTCSTFMKEKELCIHILWVLLKKFRVPKENAVIFQLCLVEREINEVIRGAYQQSQSSENTKDRPHNITSDNRNKQKQKEITEEDVCPICQDDLLMKSGEPITYCKYGCGNSVHLKCMKVWAEHQRSTGEKITKCPLCRVDFGSYQDLLDEVNNSSKKKNRAERQNVHLGATCHKCRLCPISGKCYRCVICVDYHLCHQCFTTDHHLQHSFQFRQSSSQRWRPATRITPLPNAVIDHLQNRDITDADYDLLLQLERPLEEHEGVSGHVISSYPAEVLRDHHPVLNENNTCQICLRGYQPYQSIRKLHCHHVFHRQCIDNWLIDHSTCPVDGGAISASIANEQRGSNEVAPPIIRNDNNVRGLCRRQRLLVRRREAGHQQDQFQKRLSSDLSLSGSGILVRDRSRDSSPSEETRRRVLLNRRIDCSPLSLLHGNQATSREHILLNPLTGGKPPIAPASGDSNHSNASIRRRSTVGNKTTLRRNPLTLDQKSSSPGDLSLNATGLSIDQVRHGPSNKKTGQLVRGKPAAPNPNTSYFDPRLLNHEPLVASGLAIHLPSAERIES